MSAIVRAHYFYRIPNKSDRKILIRSPNSTRMIWVLVKLKIMNLSNNPKKKGLLEPLATSAYPESEHKKT